MSMNEAALAATIILLFPMIYFLFASLTFFLRPLADPIVSWMLRGLLNVYFLVLSGVCAFGAMTFAGASRPDAALGIGAACAAALVARAVILRRVDSSIRAFGDGDRVALGRLRRLHVAGMAYNAVQLGVVLYSIPRLFPGLA